MNSCENFKLEVYKYAILSITIFLLYLPSYSQITDIKSIPDEIAFHKLEEEIVVKLLYKEQPLKKEHIKKWAFLAGHNQYNHMITIKFMDGGLSIKPALLEVGTYDLVIETSFGKCTITVYAPLDALPDTLENRAKREGITVDELKQRLGLSTPVHKTNLEIAIPKLYYEGQVLQINLPSNTEHFYIWRVNNQVILQGEGKTNFEYVFPVQGTYTIEVEERDADIPLAKAVSETSVIGYPPISYSARLRQPVKLSAVVGYNSYTWKVDGITQKETSNEITLKFNSEKKYIVECIAKGPKNGHPDAFFKTTYEIDVKK